MFALRVFIAVLAMQTTTWVEISNAAVTFCICVITSPVTARICIITSPATNATNINASIETKEYGGPSAQRTLGGNSWGMEPNARRWVNAWTCTLRV